MHPRTYAAPGLDDKNWFDAFVVVLRDVIGDALSPICLEILGWNGLDVMK